MVDPPEEEELLLDWDMRNLDLGHTVRPTRPENRPGRPDGGADPTGKPTRSAGRWADPTGKPDPTT
jgi:hypothetical protein